MAGIGFELKKLFAGGGAIRKVRAYACAGIVSSGTMLLSMALLIGMQRLAARAGAGEREREQLVALVVYAMLSSMLLTSLLSTLLSRFAADMLYRGADDRVLPSLIGASVALMVPGGMLYGLMLSRAEAIPALDRALSWLLFMELIPVWLEMGYIGAARDYRRILAVFASGVGAALAAGWILLHFGMPAATALLLSLAAGYGFMLVGFMGVLNRRFSKGSGSAFAFVEWLDRVPSLAAIGFLNMAGAFVHLIWMWFGPLGEAVAGPLRHAPTHDAAAFYAFLAMLPTSVNFVVSVEVNFCREYRRYFDFVGGGGTLTEIREARDCMVASLRQEVFRLARIQVCSMAAYAILMPYFLKKIGFTADMIAMFQVMSIGYSAYAVGNAMMLLQLYFDDRGGALLSAAAFFLANALVTGWTIHGPPLYCGVGLVAGGALLYAVSLTKLFTYAARIDRHVFCGQPVLPDERAGRWTRMARWFEGRTDAKGGVGR